MLVTAATLLVKLWPKTLPDYPEPVECPRCLSKQSPCFCPSSILTSSSMHDSV